MHFLYGEKMIRIGLIGAGRIAQIHAANIAVHPHSELVAIGDVVASAAEALATQYNAMSKNIDDIFADKSIDAVLIASPTHTHCDFIENAVAVGKNVFCEKPIDLNLERAVACQQFVAKTSCAVMVAFNRRFDPQFVALKKAVSKGEIGHVELLSITSFDPEPPPLSYIQSSGGLFRDMTIHDFDMAHHMMADLPVSIFATGTSIVNPEIAKAGDIDTAVITLTYHDGRIAVIKNSRRAAYGYDQRIEILGSEGLLQANNVLENTLVKSTTAGTIGAKPTYFFLERYMAAYKAEWAAFMDSLMMKTPLPITIEDGIIALALSEAATQSMQQGKSINLATILPSYFA